MCKTCGVVVEIKTPHERAKKKKTRRSVYMLFHTSGVINFHQKTFNLQQEKASVEGARVARKCVQACERILKKRRMKKIKTNRKICHKISVIGTFAVNFKRHLQLVFSTDSNKRRLKEHHKEIIPTKFQIKY